MPGHVRTPALGRGDDVGAVLVQQHLHVAEAHGAPADHLLELQELGLVVGHQRPRDDEVPHHGHGDFPFPIAMLGFGGPGRQQGQEEERDAESPACQDSRMG